MKIQLPLRQRRKQQLHTWSKQNTDFECESLEIVSGDASFRRYFRFVCRGQSIIAVAQSYREHGVKVFGTNRFCH